MITATASRPAAAPFFDGAAAGLPTSPDLSDFLPAFAELDLRTRHRDAVIAAHLRERPGEDVFEDRSLEITGYLPVSVEHLVAALKETV